MFKKISNKITDIKERKLSNVSKGDLLITNILSIFIIVISKETIYSSFLNYIAIFTVCVLAVLSIWLVYEIVQEIK